jgi:hypothetical protein
METYLNRIFVIKNFISKEDCQKLIDKFSINATYIPESEVIRSGFSVTIDREDYSSIINGDTLEAKVLKKMADELSKHYGTNMEIKSIFHSIMDVGGTNSPHWDNYVENGEEDVSSLLYLNEGFEGGVLSFINQKIYLKPEPGMFVFFRGDKDLLHEVEVVTSGSREALVGFSWPTSKRLSLVTK